MLFSILNTEIESLFIKDEECLRPGEPTDATFLTKLENVVGKHPHFLSHSTASNKLRRTIDRNVSI